MTNGITATCSSIISILFGHVGAFSSWLARPYVFINRRIRIVEAQINSISLSPNVRKSRGSQGY